MIDFFNENWLLIVLALYGAASDIVGGSSLKANGVVQLIMQIFGTLIPKKK